jgi:heptosyltransferase-2
LIVLPSWLGDVVMATPALRQLRRALPGAFIGGLVRPGLDELLAGTSFLDELHVDRARGVMGPKLVAAKLRPRRYDTALLLTNSFSTALITRLAFIPRRIGYDRDARGLLLTDRLAPPRRERPHRGFAPISAVEYYLCAAQVVINADAAAPLHADLDRRLELGLTPAQDAAAVAILAKAGLAADQPFAILNPGGNNPAKRWPPDRFAAAARHLIEQHGLAILINGSPGEADLARDVVARIGPAPTPVASLAELGVTIGSLKGVVQRARIMLTNDTGPRHIAAAFGVPTVALFGPTDPRWTTLADSALYIPGRPAPARELVLVADASLSPDEVADDHPERCRIDQLQTRDALGALDSLLAPAAAPAEGQPARPVRPHH